MLNPLSQTPTTETNAHARRFDRWFVAVALAGAALFALHLLYSAVCALSWKNFLMMDYGAYTNFLYNLAHGDGFRFLYEHNYLKTHLSFSFILLAPLVHLWDSPLLLIVVQWLFLAGGAAFLWRFLRRGGTAPTLAAALLFGMVAYPKTQSVMMSEFHGVAAYFLLLPALLHTATFHKKWAFLPLLILLGLREDAGLVALPMLLHISIADRWKTGYVLCAATAAYVVFAIFALYPWINGEALLGVRADEASAAAIAHSFALPRLIARAQAVFWLFLPALFLAIPFRRAWIPLLVFPSFALLQAMGSAMERQHELGFHYPAPAFAALLCAMAYAAARHAPARRWSLAPARLQRFAAIGLFAVTLVTHAERGLILDGDREHRVYASFHPQFHPLLRLARTLPKDGLLLCNQNLAAFFALRRDIMVLHYYDPARHQPEYIVTDLHEIQTPNFKPIVAAVQAGEYGFHDLQFPYLVLRRGAPLCRNPQLLQTVRQHLMAPALMASHGGDVVYDPQQGLVKEWDGTDSPEPVALAFGRAIQLPPGDYVARFTLQAPALAPAPPDGYGTLSVHSKGRAEAIAEAPISPTPDDAFADQLLPFTLTQPTLLEPRILGHAAPLRIQGILLERPGDPVETTPRRTTTLLRPDRIVD
jgi:uncharacterized membrane protein